MPHHGFFPPGVRVTAPVTPAIERARQILFCPFDFNKWIAVGVAWICLGLPVFVIGCITRHFVAPIMFLSGWSCMNAWRVLFPVVTANTGRAFHYWLLAQHILGT